MRRIPYVLVLSCLMAFATAPAFAEIDPDKWFAEGQIERDGECLYYRILAYRMNAGMPSEHWVYRIFEGSCDGSCLEEVYHGPLSLYGGDIPIATGGDSGQLPINVTSSGTGYVALPPGTGGTLTSGGSGQPTCDAVYMPNGSSVLVIEASLL